MDEVLFLHIKVRNYLEAFMMTNEDKQIVSRFALQMKTSREEKGISQEKLAEYANLHRTYIGSLERAEKIPSLVTVVKIAKALNLDISKLIIY